MSRSSSQHPAHGLTSAEIAAMFGDRYLAVDRAWEDRFFTGALVTLLDARAARNAGMFDDDDDSDPNAPYQRIGGVGLIEISGPLMQYGGGWWFDGHESIRARCEAAAADPRVRLAAMRIDSPGGVVAGCFDNVRGAIAAFAAAGKPVVAWCGGNGAYSGGYAWACVADEISVTDTSGVGSVGVLGTLCDRTKMTEAAGLRIDVIRSGQRKAEGHPDIPTTDGAIAREQALVNSMADVFAGIVGPSREMTPADVLKPEGECFYGQRAIDIGFADRVESFDAFLARCMTRAEEMSMKMTAQRLGLAADANEADVVKVIDALEARTIKAEGDVRKASEESERLGEEFCEFVCAEALLAGKGTKASIDGDKAMLDGVPAPRRARGLRDKYTSIERGVALPKESKAPTDPPLVEGPSVAAAKAGAGKIDGGKMTMTEIAKHYGSADFDRLMSEHQAAQRGSVASQFPRLPKPGAATVS